MRLAMRALVVLTFPVLALGWLSTTRILPGPPDFRAAFPLDPVASTATFALAGVALLVTGSLVLTLTDVGRALLLNSTVRRRPIALPVVLLTAYVGYSLLVAWPHLYDASVHALFWLSLLSTIAIGFVISSGAMLFGRALFGMWSRTDLPLWPGRRAAVIVLLLVTFAATPVGTPPTRDGWTGRERSTGVVSLAERVWMDATGDSGYPHWPYTDDDSGFF